MKTTDNYFNELHHALRRLPAKDREAAISYYREFAADAEIFTYEDMEKRFGSPKNLASSIYADTAEKMTRENKKGSFGTFAIALASLLSLPLSLPVIISLGAVSFGLLISAAAIIFSIGVSLFAVAISGAGLFIHSFTFLVPFAPWLFFKSITGAFMLLALSIIPLILIFLGIRRLLKKLTLTITDYTKRRSSIE